MKHDATSDLRRKIFHTIIDLKTEELRQLREDQKERVDSVSSAEEDEDMNDMFESTRDQMMNEIELKAGPLDFLANEISHLKEIDTGAAHNHVEEGAIVETDKRNFVIAVAQPPFDVEGKSYTAISTSAPIYAEMSGKNPGEKFSFRDTHYQINRIF